MRRRVITVANEKGGSGKTATAVNLAAALADAGHRVLLVDLDPSGNASSWLGHRSDGSALRALFEKPSGELAPLVTSTGVDRLSLIPSGRDLTAVDRNPRPMAELALAAHIDRLNGEWDFIIIDTRPGLGVLTTAGLAAGREVLIPVDCASPQAMEGVIAVTEALEYVRETLRPSGRARPPRILAMRVEQRTRLAQDVLATLRRDFGKAVLKTEIRKNTRLGEAPSHAKPITVYDPDSAGAEDFRALAAEILEGASS